jgi:serine/threonine-protein kinase
LHDRGLVHLDVKPANMLVTSQETSTEHVYLADFGLTRRGATGHRTRSGDFLGSPTYAAPEHLRGEPVDGRTDAYSLTCVLFACLTGRPPFQGKVSEVIQGHLNLQPPAVTGLVALPGAIDEVIRRGMAKDPKTRYANCKELVAAARRALAQAPRQEPPRPARAEQPQQRAYGPPPPQPQRQAPPPPAGPGEFVRLRPPVPIGSSAFTAEKSGRRWLMPVVVGLIAIAAIVAAIVFLSSSDDGGGGQTPQTTVPQIPGSIQPTHKTTTTPPKRTQPPSIPGLPTG